MPNLRIYDPFERMQFTNHHCFLCGQVVDPKERLPVYPAWLIRKYDLAQKPIQLLDKSIRAIGDLTIPCCTACQINHVAPLNETMAEAGAKGLAGWQALEEKSIFLWLSRIVYGMLVTELEVELNPLIAPEYGVGANPKMLTKFQSFFFLLQAMRVPIEFADFTPCSLFILHKDKADDNLAFELQDDLTTMMISLEMDEVVLVCCLLDNGLVKRALRKVWADVEGRPLHPHQVAEFKARAYYGAYLLNVIPEYFPRPVQPGDTALVYDTLIDDVTTSVFNPWEPHAYAQTLEEMLKRWDIRQAEILQNPQSPISFLYDDQGNFKPTVLH